MRRILLTARSSAYVLIVLAAGLCASAYSLRSNGLFSCQANGYESDRYLAYCQATSYGDYDHGAFWFELEPSATEAVRNAQVLFLGNSRTQIGFSTTAISDWFASPVVRYYLLGFSHNGNYVFTAPLLNKLQLKPKVVVLNVDLFFEQSPSAPAKTVMYDEAARSRYEEKRRWQRLHQPICASLPLVCWDEIAFFRSRSTGAWFVTGGQLKGGPVTYNDRIDQAAVTTYTAIGNGFLSRLPVNRDCVILTIVPNTNTEVGTARSIAAALRLNLVAPQPHGLTTFDQSHLDGRSAQRWSAAFIEAAGPAILKCLDRPDAGAKSWER